MSILEAVKTGLRKSFVISGRASRKEFWSLYLFATIVWVILMAGLISSLDPGSQRTNSGLIFLLAPALLLVVPVFTAQIRRLHDTGRSGWWLLVSLIPFGSIILLAFLLFGSQDGDNRFGPHPYRPGSAPAEALQVPASWGTPS